MNVNAMRRADRWLGVPACLFLTLVRRLTGRRCPEAPPKSILFVKLAEQGSTVLAYPALRWACARFGRANVYFLVFEENRPILDAMEVLPPENVIAIRAEGLIGTIWGAVRAIGRMRRLRLDAAIDLEFFARSSAAMTYLSGAGRRVGFHPFHGEASYRGDLMTHRVSFNPYLHTSQTFELLARICELPPDGLPTLTLPPVPIGKNLPVFEPHSAELDRARQILDQARAGSGGGNRGDNGVAPLVLLNANASDLLPLRRWPSERYVELARRLLESDPATAIAFTGAPNERAPVELLVRQVGDERCFSLAGKTTLRELLAIYCLADVLVTNDSGPAHFATLTPIDVVTLFGPETPDLFGAPGPRTHILTARLACSPCVNAFNDRQSACRDNQCMQAIGVDAVLAEVRRALATRAARSPRDPAPA